MNKKQVRQIPKEDMKDYGKYFKDVRISLGLSLSSMAEIIGVHCTNISRWEKGESVPQTNLGYIIRLYKNAIKKHVDHLESLHSLNI